MTDPTHVGEREVTPTEQSQYAILGKLAPELETPKNFNYAQSVTAIYHTRAEAMFMLYWQCKSGNIPMRTSIT